MIPAPLHCQIRCKIMGSKRTLAGMDVDDDLASEFSDHSVSDDGTRADDVRVSVETGMEGTCPADLPKTSLVFMFSHTQKRLVVQPNNYVAVAGQSRPTKPLSDIAQINKTTHTSTFLEIKQLQKKLIKVEQSTPLAKREVIDLTTSPVEPENPTKGLYRIPSSSPAEITDDRIIVKSDRGCETRTSA